MATTVNTPVGLLAAITELRFPTERAPMGLLLAITKPVEVTTPAARVHVSRGSSRVHVVPASERTYKAED